MNCADKIFVVNKDDRLLNDRIPFSPLLLDLSWEDSQQKFYVYVTPNEDGKVLYVSCYEEKIHENEIIFSPSNSMALNDSNSILVEIKNGKAQIDLGKKAKSIGNQRTSKNFVLVFVVEGTLRKVSQPFHARSKWVLKNDEENTDALIKRLQNMREDIRNVELIRQIETVKIQWRKEKEKCSKSDSAGQKMWEQKMAICTWLQTKLVNDSEEVPLCSLLNQTQQKYLKEGKTKRKSPDTTQEIIDIIQQNSHIAVQTFPDSEPIFVDPIGITFGGFSEARNSNKKRVGDLKPAPIIKKRDLPRSFEIPHEFALQLYEEFDLKFNDNNKLGDTFMDCDLSKGGEINSSNWLDQVMPTEWEMNFSFQ